MNSTRSMGEGERKTTQARKKKTHHTSPKKKKKKKEQQPKPTYNVYDEDKELAEEVMEKKVDNFALLSLLRAVAMD